MNAGEQQRVSSQTIFAKRNLSIVIEVWVLLSCRISGVRVMNLWNCQACVTGQTSSLASPAAVLLPFNSGCKHLVECWFYGATGRGQNRTFQGHRPWEEVSGAFPRFGP